MSEMFGSGGGGAMMLGRRIWCWLAGHMWRERYKGAYMCRRCDKFEIRDDDGNLWDFQ